MLATHSWSILVFLGMFTEPFENGRNMCNLQTVIIKVVMLTVLANNFSDLDGCMVFKKQTF